MEVNLDMYWAVTSFLFGAVVGSFLNVVIFRLPLGLSLVHPPSACPKCSTPIHFYDNVPVLSYLILAGKCRRCDGPISMRYPVNEAVTGLLAMSLYLSWGFSPTFLVYFVFCAAMVVVFWIDVDYLIIPDVISLNGIAVGWIAATLDYIPGVIWSQSLFGAFLGGFGLYLPALAYEKMRGMEGLGGGDIKLMAMMGAFTGPSGVVFILFLASLTGCAAAVLGMLFKGRGSTTPIPFGPFLSVSAVLFVFFGSDAIELLFNLSQKLWLALRLV